jgi:hypothetical protein
MDGMGRRMQGKAQHVGGGERHGPGYIAHDESASD